MSGLHAHFTDHHHAFEPWIFQLSGQHGVDFVRDFFAHAFVTVIGWTHRCPRRCTPHSLNNLEFLPDQKRAEDAIGRIQDLLQGFLHVTLFIRQRHYPYN
jgi:hypothetical protein